MVGVQLKREVHGQRLVLGVGHGGEHLVHLHGQSLVACETHSRALEPVGEDDLCDLAVKRLFHAFEQRLRLGLLLLHDLLLLVRGKIQLGVGHGQEGLVGVLVEDAQRKLVHLVGAAQQIVALVADALGLRQRRHLHGVIPRGIVDARLPLGHGVHILLQGDELVACGGTEQQQILEEILVGAVLRVHAVLEGHAKGLPKRLVLVPLTL